MKPTPTIVPPIYIKTNLLQEEAEAGMGVYRAIEPI